MTIANDNWQQQTANQHHQTDRNPYAPSGPNGLGAGSADLHVRLTLDHANEINTRMEKRAEELVKNIPQGLPQKTYDGVLKFFMDSLRLNELDVGKSAVDVNARVGKAARDIQDKLPQQAQMVAKMNPSISADEAAKMADFFSVILEDLSNTVQQAIPEVTGAKFTHISSLAGNQRAQQVAKQTMMDKAYIVQFTINTDGMGAISPDILKNTFGQLQDAYPHSMTDFEYNLDSKSYQFVIPNEEAKKKILHEMTKADVENPVWNAINIQKIMPYKEHQQQMEKQASPAVAQR